MEMYLLIGVILSGVVLVIYFSRGQHAVWGGATLGILVGVVVGLIKGDVLNFLGWGFIGGTLVGFVFDLLGVLSDRLQHWMGTRSGNRLEGTEVLEKMADVARWELAVAAAWEQLSGVKSKRHWGVSTEFFQELAAEWADFEPITESTIKSLSEAEVDELFAYISDSQALSLEEKAVAHFALLGVLEGLLPSQRGQSLIRSLFGDEMIDAVLAKRDEKNAEWEKP
jgi:hypothetical protein